MREIKTKLLRLILWVMVHLFYRIEVLGAEHLPRRSPAILVSNHLSYADPVLVSAGALPRRVRFFISREIHGIPGLHWFFRLMRTIPVEATDRAGQLRSSLRTGRQALREGDLIGIFGEGRISRLGQTLAFRNGFNVIATEETLVVPTHIDGIWGSLFSFERGRFFFKWPRRFRRKITVSFGVPVDKATPPAEIRLRVMELGTAALERRLRREGTPYPLLAAGAEALQVCHPLGPEDVVVIDLAPSSALSAPAREWCRKAGARVAAVGSVEGTVLVTDKARWGGSWRLVLTTAAEAEAGHAVLALPGLGVVALSVPDISTDGSLQQGTRRGAYGRAAPGVALRVRDNRLEVRASMGGGWTDAGFEATEDAEGFVWPPAI